MKFTTEELKIARRIYADNYLFHAPNLVTKLEKPGQEHVDPDALHLIALGVRGAKSPPSGYGFWKRFLRLCAA